MASWATIAKAEPKVAAEAPLEPESKPRVAVLDANAIINGSGLLNLMRFADRVVTVPEVLKEVRDKQSRSVLATLPFTIETQEPSEESLKAGESSNSVICPKPAICILCIFESNTQFEYACGCKIPCLTHYLFPHLQKLQL